MAAWECQNPIVVDSNIGQAVLSPHRLSEPTVRRGQELIVLVPIFGTRRQPTNGQT